MLFELMENMEKANVPVAQIVSAAVTNMHARAVETEIAAYSYRAGLRTISQAVLRVLAESIAIDPAANDGSRRESDLSREIESILLDREERSRDNG